MQCPTCDQWLKWSDELFDYCLQCDGIIYSYSSTKSICSSKRQIILDKLFEIEGKLSLAESLAPNSPPPASIISGIISDQHKIWNIYKKEVSHLLSEQQKHTEVLRLIDALEKSDEFELVEDKDEKTE